jgi:UTP--glucose-1-phosphate uridylyltransferase
MTSNSNFKPVRKAVFPVAGLGTRVLPATKVMPKEMLTVNGKPLIQWVVEEALQAGIEQVILVTGPRKEIIEKHFDNNPELLRALADKKKENMIKVVQESELPEGQMSFVRQSNPRGLGHAIWCARHLVGNEPFAVILPDDIVKNGIGCLSQLVETYNGCSTASAARFNVVAIKPVPLDQTQKYGTIEAGNIDGKNIQITGMVEKPKPDDAPSNLSIIGRYILQPEIFDILGKGKKGAGGEIQLTDAMEELLKTQEFVGHLFEGEHFDCGNKGGLLFANLAYGLDDDEIDNDRVNDIVNGGKQRKEEIYVKSAGGATRRNAI